VQGQEWGFAVHSHSLGSPPLDIFYGYSGYTGGSYLYFAYSNAISFSKGTNTAFQTYVDPSANPVPIGKRIPFLAPDHGKRAHSVPEPPALPLFATGLGLIALLVRKRKAPWA
jgi:hypothetical protein